MITACGEAPTAVRNRHEAFGLRQSGWPKSKRPLKAIDGDTSILLGTLPDATTQPLRPSPHLQQHPEAAATMIEAAAEMRRTLRDLYEAENSARSEEVTPMEEWASAAQFQDADPTDNDETEDE